MSGNTAYNHKDVKTVNQAIQIKDIARRNHAIRGIPVLPDRDPADYCSVATRVWKQAVRRNADRYPEALMLIGFVDPEEFKRLST